MSRPTHHQEFRVGTGSGAPPNDLDAVWAGVREIRGDDVRFKLLNNLYRRLAVSRLSSHLPARVPVEDFAQASTHEILIIDDNDANGRFDSCPSL